MNPTPQALSEAQMAEAVELAKEIVDVEKQNRPFHSSQYKISVAFLKCRAEIEQLAAENIELRMYVVDEDHE